MLGAVMWTLEHLRGVGRVMTGHHWRRNLPLPEAHLFSIAGATALHWVIPKPMERGGVARFAGWISVVVGAALIVGSMRAAGNVELERPDELVTHGPYARSRHPMYVGWTLIYGGISLVTGNVWLVSLFPALLGLVHLETTREEKELRSAFGAEYDEYRSRVRRYF